MQAENWFSGYRKLSYPPPGPALASQITGASRAAACRFDRRYVGIRIAPEFDVKTRFTLLPGDDDYKPYALNA